MKKKIYRDQNQNTLLLYELQTYSSLKYNYILANHGKGTFYKLTQIEIFQNLNTCTFMIQIYSTN